MADRDEEYNESAEDQAPDPVETPDKKPVETGLGHGRTPWLEEAYMTLGIVYYGGHIAHWVWLQALEQLIPLVQPYV